MSTPVHPIFTHDDHPVHVRVYDTSKRPSINGNGAIYLVVFGLTTECTAFNQDGLDVWSSTRTVRIDKNPSHCGTRIAYTQLPPLAQKRTMDIYCELWGAKPR